MKKQREMEKMSVADAVSTAHGNLMSLGEELRTWADNIKEKFGSTDKYSRLDEAASTLENLNEPDVPEELGKIEIEVVKESKRRRNQTRPRRRDHYVYLLEAAGQAVQEKMDEVSEKKEPTDAEQELIDAADTLINDIEELKSEAENVEFPGMYG